MIQYNYNKNYTNKKIFINNLKKNILFNLFYSRFPSNLIVSKTKSSLKKGKLLKNIDKKEEIFFNNQYIYYNQYTFNFFILDIDHKNYTINDFINILDDNFISPPSWIVETNGGYQMGFILEKPFNLNEKYLSKRDETLIKYTKYLLKKMLNLFQGDFNTIRLQGFWKNPIGVNKKYKLFVNKNNFFNLSDFDIYSPIFDEIQKKENKKGNEGGNFHSERETIKYLVKELVKGNLNILKNIKEGYRNSFIWYLGMYLIKHDEDWEEKLNTYNINIKEPLKRIEMESIKRSIKNYTKKKKNFVNLGNYELWTPELKNIYIKNYQKKKGIIKHHRDEQKEFNKNKVLQSIYKLRSEGKKISIRKVSVECGLNKNTVNKYFKLLKQDEKFKVLFEK